MDFSERERLIEKILKLIESNTFTQEERQKLKSSLLVILREMESERKQVEKRLEETLKTVDQSHKEFVYSLPPKVRNCPLKDFDGEIDVHSKIEQFGSISIPTINLSIKSKKENLDPKQPIIQNTINSSRNFSKLINSSVIMKNAPLHLSSAKKTVFNKIAAKKFMEHIGQSQSFVDKIAAQCDKLPRVVQDNENINIVFMSDHGTPLIHPSHSNK